MSLAAMTWALTSAPVDNAQEHVLLIALADQAGPDGTAAWPGQKRLASRGRCSARTVRRHLAALEARGVIMRGDQRLVAHIRPDKRPIVWDLNLSMVAPPVDDDDDFPTIDVSAGQRPAKLSGGAPGKRPDKMTGRSPDVRATGQTGSSDRTLLSYKPSLTIQEPLEGGSVREREAAVDPVPDTPTPESLSDSSSAPAAVAASPSRHCPRHPGGTSDPCRACGDARVACEAAEAQAAEDRKRTRNDARASERRAINAAIDACDHCNHTGYRHDSPFITCDHTPDQLDRRLAGAAACRAAVEGLKSRREAAAAPM